MNTFIARTLALLTLAATSLQSQVPQLINYQGRVAVHGVNFDGPGKFKFAIVDAAGTTSYWSNDGTSIAGSEPAVAIKLTVTTGLYSVLLGDTTLPNMAAIPERVFKNAGVLLRVWFNDGSNGSQLLTPDQSLPTPAGASPIHVHARAVVPLPTEAWQQHAGMSTPGVRFDHTAVWTGSEMIVWGGYSRRSANTDSALNDGGRYTPATNSWTLLSTLNAPEARASHTAVWTGTEMIVWGGSHFLGGVTFDQSFFSNGGRYNPAGNNWASLNTNGGPTARNGHTAVWTGSEMIIWGGYNSGFGQLNDGGRFNPAGIGSWTPVPNTLFNGPPAVREGHTAVWNPAGNEMIVWGGYNSVFPELNDGGRFNPAGNGSWTPIFNNLLNTPAPRSYHTAVWTGSEMIVWGGYDGGPLIDGGRFTPAGNGTWTSIPNNLTNTPAARSSHTAVWNTAGNEMIIWGGKNAGFNYLNDGGRYTPGGGWTPVNPTGAPVARASHTAVWTGSEMIVWGGASDGTVEVHDDGGRYTPGGGWTPVTTGAPASRYGHTAVWTGSEMIVWGGNNGFYLNTGGRYTPAANTWSPVNPAGAPAARDLHTAVWTGSEMIVWGGFDGTNSLNDGGRYHPAGNSWTEVNAAGAPGARNAHTAVWTGSEMIVWGGHSGSNYLNNGGRYTPGGGWAPVNPAGAPGARNYHTAVWTGSEMIVWGGNNSTFLDDGGRYTPGGAWTPVNPAGAPGARANHTAVWNPTANEMIVWGGVGVGTYRKDGGRYTPGGGWAEVNSAGAPDGRFSHTAVWTGSEMIVWGGRNGSGYLNTGGRYTPTGNSWMPVTTTGAPAARYGHTAVWADIEMIVWGGDNSSNYFNDTFSYTFDPLPSYSGLIPITSIDRSDGNLTIGFTSVRNVTYTLLRSDNLAIGSWIDTGLTTLGNGATRTITVPAGSPARRFFRVVTGP